MRIAVTFLVVLCGIALTSATICVPYSRFKIDCNSCYCSGDGTKYACTKKFCSQQKFTYDDQDYVLTNQKVKANYPSDDEGYQNDVPKDVDWDDVKTNEINDDDEDEGKSVYDQSGEDNSIDIDEEPPADYAYKKSY